MGEAAAWLLALGQQGIALGGQIWQQQDGGQRSEEGSVCFVAIAPFLFGAAVVALRSFRRALRARFA